MIGAIVLVVLLIAAYMVQASTKKPNRQGRSDGYDRTEKMKGREKDDEDDRKIEVKVKGGNFYFQPNTITVKKGDKVEIEFESIEGAHNMIIDEFNVKSKTVSAGDDDDVEFIANTVGRFEYYCGVGDHRTKGMVGTMIVEE